MKKKVFISCDKESKELRDALFASADRKKKQKPYSFFEIEDMDKIKCGGADPQEVFDEHIRAADAFILLLHTRFTDNMRHEYELARTEEEKRGLIVRTLLPEEDSLSESELESYNENIKPPILSKELPQYERYNGKDKEHFPQTIESVLNGVEEVFKEKKKKRLKQFFKWVIGFIIVSLIFWVVASTCKRKEQGEKVDTGPGIIEMVVGEGDSNKEVAPDPNPSQTGPSKGEKGITSDASSVDPKNKLNASSRNEKSFYISGDGSYWAAIEKQLETTYGMSPNTIEEKCKWKMSITEVPKHLERISSNWEIEWVEYSIKIENLEDGSYHMETYRDDMYRKASGSYDNAVEKSRNASASVLAEKVVNLIRQWKK
jgi:hypothetical protein